MNESVRDLHKRLGKTVAELSKRLGTVTTTEEAEAILREMEEVNFRVTVAGRLLFAETTASLNERIDRVLGAADDVDAEIESLEKVRDVVRAVGSYLGTVDKVLDALKQRIL